MEDFSKEQIHILNAMQNNAMQCIAVAELLDEAKKIAKENDDLFVRIEY